MAMLRTSDRGADKSTPDTKASRAAHLLESCSSSKKTDDGESTSKSSVVTIAATMSKLKKQIQADRVAYVKARLEANNANIRAYVANAEKLSKANVSSMSIEDRNPDSVDLLTENIRKSACKPSGLEPSLLEKENLLSQDEASIVLMPGASLMGSKNMARPVKIPVVSKLPPYTTWIFLDRNQRMTEDQSVVGRRRIYYDPNGNEALICSDSEEENMDDEEEKHEFSKCDDYVIWNAVQEHGSSETLLEALGNCIDAKPSEIEARYEVLLKEDAKRNFNCSSDILAFEGKPLLGVLNRSLSQQPHKEHSPSDGEISKVTSDEDKCEDKDLDAAMDSFDNLFCRRCLVFDCRLHGCSQSVVLPSEKQTPWSNSEGSSTPCGPDCYLLASGNDKRNESKLNGLEVVPLKNKTMNGESSKTKIINVERSSVYVRTGTATCEANRRRSSGTVLDNSTDVCESTNEEPTKGKDDAPKTNTTTRGKKPGRKAGPAKKTSKRRAEEVLINIRKRTCITTDMENLASGGSPSPKKASATIPNDAMEQNAEPSGKLPKRGNGLRGGWKKVGRPALSSSKSKKSDIITQNSKQKEEPMPSESSKLEEELKPNLRQITNGFMNGSHQLKLSDSKCESIVDDGFNAKKGWSELEKGLYDKGIAMFGKNSCLISRNLLKGMKTCVEVAERIMEHEAAAQRRSGDGHLSGADACGKHDSSAAMDADVRPRTRFWRRRGKMRRLKYTWKSAGHSTVRKRMGDGKDQPCKQYTPCGCQSNCGKQCPCMRNGTCCEKYCGCAKSCKNRFRGCHCAKSQCRSRHCPCFAAGRECDPDVCRNCWVGCGDGSLGGPPQRGDNYECRNMKLLLKQQQRVLLGRSDVAGWGAFLKNPVSKHDYLGEYTGELISHKEADKRGKIYDRENSSFLFNLNDQFVLDAYRKGDKLKFANHSPNPNCYAKVIMVAGDHRVGIFAKERILAGEELFYDYRYEADRAPVWARKPEAATTTKGSENSGSGGRAQKVA